MLKLKVIAAMILVSAVNLYSQDSLRVDSIAHIADTLKLGSDVELGFFTENLDTVKSDQVLLRKTEEKLMEFPKVITDSLYIDRLQSIESPLEFPFNSKVKAYIELYTVRKRQQVEIMLGLSNYYFPMFEEALDKAGLPLELKYLPIIESALNPRAYSRAGASGLWQFMYATGKMYGLKVDSYIDERRDPVKSTQAAVNYLKDLYKQYNDWYLVIAAYNCGPGNVNKAIYRSGGKRDFWQIYYRLPRETRGYVPAFIAAAYSMTYHKEHLIEAKNTDLPMATDTLMISDLLHFNQIAKVTGIAVDDLRKLNPQYSRDVIPAKKKAYALRIPIEATEKFITLEDSVFAYQREKYFASNRLVINPSDSYNAPSTPKNKSKVYYVVKSGDAVGLIADWFDVYSSDLRYWNNIRRNLIKVGQKLVVYVPKDKLSHYKQINGMSYAKKQALSGKVVATSPVVTKSASSLATNGAYVYYTVRRGDNLWSIAKKYPGTSNDDIMRLNNLTSAAKISPGQKLKIKPKS